MHLSKNDDLHHPPDAEPSLQILTVDGAGGVLVITMSFLEKNTSLFSVVHLTSYYSANLDSARQEMEVSAEGTDVNCFFLTHFGRHRLATVNFPTPIGAVRCAQQGKVQTEAEFQIRTLKTGRKEGKLAVLFKI